MGNTNYCVFQIDIYLIMELIVSVIKIKSSINDFNRIDVLYLRENP